MVKLAFYHGHGTAIAHGKATFCVWPLFPRWHCLGGIFMDASKIQKNKKRKKKKEKENSNKKNKQTNKHKISMTVPRVISMGWIRTRSSTNHKKWNVPKSTHKRKTWHENNFKKHLLQKFLNINASRKHFCIKDILRYLIHFLSRLYCTN